MSELSKLQKHLQEVEANLEEYSDMKCPDMVQDESLLATAALLLEGGTRDRCHAFKRKLAEKDAVTGNPRFGPATVAKIQALLTLYTHLCTLLEPLVEAAVERQHIQQHQDEREREVARLTEGEDGEKAAAERIQQLRVYTHHPAPSPMVPLSIFRPDLLPATSSTDGGETEEEQEEATRLREKAESVRTRKRSQAELEAMARCEENALLRRVADLLTAAPTAAATSPTPEGSSSVQQLRQCLLSLQQAVMATEAQQLVEFGLVVEEGAEVLRGALGCVRSVLSNIHQHPDNEKLRRIRINHPAIRERLTKLGVPAVHLLVAVGFRARAVTALGLPIPDEEEGEGGAEERKGEGREGREGGGGGGERGEGRSLEVDVDTLTREVSRASEAEGTHATGRLTLLLVMSEPLTETAAGREAWKVWFDGLQTCVDVITAFEKDQGGV